ncbi:hypothetical protein ABH935_004922 [Catenulispora sp. GAS73]|uniref:hypothetical protein n=1 Tax=Catenulispora sp. GAS73 TaxID=3156269 RepID=UPI003519728D
MDELDDLLRDTFRAREDEAGDATGLAAAVRSGHARHTVKRRQLLVVGTVGVLAAGGSSALALARHGSSAPNGAVFVAARDGNGRPSVTTSSPGGSATSPPSQAGTRAWSSHGLQVRVPQDWKANQTQCGTPIAPTVLIGGGAVPACALNHAPAVDVVAFGTATVLDPDPEPALHPTTVGGHAAKTGTERIPDGRTVTLLVVPDLDVSVTVKSKNAALVAGIVGSAQIVDTDANGCASQATTVEPAGKPARSGAQTTMVPDKPIKATVCHYAAPYTPGQAAFNGPTFLTNSSAIAPDQIGKLTDTINTLTPGQARWTGLPGSCPPAAHDGYLFHFTYASGPPLDVYLHTSDCDHIGFDNGAITGYLSQKFVDNLQVFLPDMAFQAPDDAIK